MLALIGAALGLALLAAPASACPEPGEELVFHSCWGEARAELLLLPEELPLSEPPEEGVRLLVTGAYTGREPREEGRPAPVGFHMQDGRLITRHMSAMDGLLIIDPETGAVSLENRASVPMDGRVLNLRQVGPRQEFIDRAAEAGLDVMQSHLLIIDGRIDVNERADAARYRRRILFTENEGFGVFETGEPVTLFEAARRLQERYAPDMALNLDMGTYDFCLIARGGVERRCGLLGRGQADRLSNLLMLSVQ